MDFLKQRPSSWNALTRLRVGASAIVLLLAAACTYLSQIGADGSVAEDRVTREQVAEEQVGVARFDHALHAEKTDLECTSCHRGADTADDAGMPSIAQCSLCHKDLDAGKPPEKQASILFAGDAVMTAHVTEIDEEVRFSHESHVAKYEVACAECHGDVAATRAVTASARVDMDGCIRCHQQRTGRQEECSACHEQIRVDRAPADHAPEWRQHHGGVVRTVGNATAARCTLCHVEERDCISCHQTTPPEDHHGDWTRRHGGVVRMEGSADAANCTMCHVQERDCVSCHQTTVPESHLREWTRRHGGVVRMQGSADAADCTMCHVQERDCIACHQVEPPADHTNYWRQRGHGIAVRIDRNRCSECHQTDSCERCHQETAPRSHTGSFGSPLDRHCVTCHLPLSSSGCVTCHKSTPSHAQAAPMPPDHLPGMNCRQCHGLSAPLPHPDKGDSCTSCHR